MPYQDFGGVDKLAPGFEKMVGEALIRSELGGVSDGYQLDHAGKNNSGYTFGGNQMDLGSGKSSYKDTFNDIIHNAKDENSEPIILNPDEFLTAIHSDLTSQGNPNALSPEDHNLINQALSSDYGREAIDNAFVHDIHQRVAYVDNIIDNLPDGSTKEALKSSEEMRLYLNDYHNQLGIEPDGLMVQYLSGEPVTVGDKPENKQTFQLIDDNITPQELLVYIENQQQFRADPNQFEQRYMDSDQTALADRHFEQLVEQQTHIPTLQQEFEGNFPHSDLHLDINTSDLDNPQSTLDTQHGQHTEIIQITPMAYEFQADADGNPIHNPTPTENEQTQPNAVTEDHPNASLANELFALLPEPTEESPTPNVFENREATSFTDDLFALGTQTPIEEIQLPNISDENNLSSPFAEQLFALGSTSSELPDSIQVASTEIESFANDATPTYLSQSQSESQSNYNFVEYVPEHLPSEIDLNEILANTHTDERSWVDTVAEQWHSSNAPEPEQSVPDTLDTSSQNFSDIITNIDFSSTDHSFVDSIQQDSGYDTGYDSGIGGI